MTRIAIVAARRTPQGRFLGKLARHSAIDLAVAAGEATLAGVNRASIDQVIVGNVLGAGQGMNIARQVALRLNLPLETPAFTVNMMCASGMQAAILAAQAIRSGEARVVLCGGAESMSNAPYLLDRARTGYKLGDGTIIDSLLRDGLVDAFTGEHMGITAERLAHEFNVSRQAQDRFALRSQARYADAHATGAFREELVEVGGLAEDEHPRPGTSLESLAALKPTFKSEGSVTPGNASGVNDGAAMLLVCSEEAAAHNAWTPLAFLEASASVGCEPARMGLGPVLATRRLCDRLNTGLQAFDAIELNEAFAAQALACLHELHVSPEDDRLNQHGGAIAMGHPIGATGARLLVSLTHRISRHEIKRGLATLCVGGGMGAAVALSAERLRNAARA